MLAKSTAHTAGEVSTCSSEKDGSDVAAVEMGIAGDTKEGSTVDAQRRRYRELRANSDIWWMRGGHSGHGDGAKFRR